MVDSEPISRIWPVRLNGIDTAPATTPATRVASSRIPSTRQKSPFDQPIDRVIDGKTPRRSKHDQRWSETEHVHR